MSRMVILSLRLKAGLALILSGLLVAGVRAVPSRPRPTLWLPRSSSSLRQRRPQVARRSRSWAPKTSTPICCPRSAARGSAPRACSTTPTPTRTASKPVLRQRRRSRTRAWSSRTASATTRSWITCWRLRRTRRGWSSTCRRYCTPRDPPTDRNWCRRGGYGGLGRSG